MALLPNHFRSFLEILYSIKRMNGTFFISLAHHALFGADHFIIPSMLAILALLTFLRKPLEKGESGQ